MRITEIQRHCLKRGQFFYNFCQKFIYIDFIVFTENESPPPPLRLGVGGFSADYV